MPSPPDEAGVFYIVMPSVKPETVQLQASFLSFLTAAKGMVIMHYSATSPSDVQGIVSEKLPTLKFSAAGPGLPGCPSSPSKTAKIVCSSNNSSFCSLG
jgi:hypothetical protein